MTNTDAAPGSTTSGAQAPPSLRQRWAVGAETLGAWLSTSNSIIADLAGRSGFDFVCVDTQHGAIEYAGAVPMIQGIELGGGIPIARVPWNEPGIIGKMLDAGCHGVIVPMVNDRQQAEAVVRACRYAPAGVRSWGPTVVQMRHPGYQQWADETVAVIPMIETTEALRHLDDIVSTPGVDAVYVGPADLSVSLGLPPGNNDGEPLFEEALAAIVAACDRSGVVAGIHATGSLAARRREQGFRMITVANDVLAVRAGLAAELALAREGQGDAARSTDMY
jgi:4-hydroxy-2-oxoheptanedioate aldolase